VLNNDWGKILKPYFESAEFQRLISFLDTEYKIKHICPARQDLFKALELCSYQDTKVIILGQDPYHTPGVADGLAFSVSKNAKLPPSLKNIYQEIENEYHKPIAETGSLIPWAKQGVLLLNTCLSVEAHKPLSHQDIGWHKLIELILIELNKKEGIVFLLWGKKALCYQQYLDNENNLILYSAHPSPFSARSGFFGNMHFVKCNNFLKEPIDWYKVE